MMTPVTHAKDQLLAVVGLGGSGLVSAHALVAGGAKVVAWDDSALQREKALASGITIAAIADMPWREIQSLVLAPGIPLTHKDGLPYAHQAVQLARQHGVEVIGDIELFCRERAARAPHAPLVAITGTNGKSTTTALIAHICRSAGRDTQMGGNIGAPILSLAPPAEHRVHVIEVSSFQIDLAPGLEPDVGLMLNLTPDHLDRHGDIENYWSIKQRMVVASRHAVIGIDDAWGQRSAAALPEDRRSTVSTLGKADFVFHDGVVLQGAAELASLRGIGSLRGEHNGQNATAAIVACMRLEISAPEIQASLKTFPGLAHRMEMIGKNGKVLFVNDSKATNADSTEKALTSFPGGIFWIVGGKAKEGGIAPLSRHFGRVEKAYLIGASSAEFSRTLRDRIPFEMCETLDVAVARAAMDAVSSSAEEPVVLLSPACASYDQFPNFEVRGDAFRRLAHAIMKKPAIVA